MIRDGRWLRGRPSVRALLGIAAGTLAVIVGCGVVVFAQQPDDPQGSEFLRIDPDRIVITSSDAFTPCGECHTSEWDVWRQTPHATGFDDMHRTESAQDILEQMDLRLAKRQGSVCMRCHYTVGPSRNAMAGVSCESCHGPAQDWVEIHSDWGPGVDHPDGESAEHREERIRASEEAGMLRPSGDIYAVAANCFECHTVPNEELVNRGGHSTGTAAFDLLERTEAIRHNYLHEQWGEDLGNREPSAERTRVMFVVGRILGYEFALRGLAEATSSGRFANAMGRRVSSAYRELEEVAVVAEISSVTEILGLGADLRLVHDNREELEEAAEEIRALGQEFSNTADGAALESLDPLIAGERPTIASPVVEADPPPADPEAPPSPEEEVAATPEEPAPPPELPGEVRRRPAWFPSFDGPYDIVGAGNCTTCHAGAEDWWFGDPHEQTGRRLVGEDPKARQIAELYGIGAAGMARGDQICMSCHATLNQASQVVDYGVSCESCHGPGSGYLEPHEDGGNPQLGMIALKEASPRAQNCVRCHHITDERLLAAGHPSGSGYDVVAANASIEHWPGRRPTRGREGRGESAYQPVADGDLRSAFQSLTGQRPIPTVAVVTPPRPAAQPAAQPGDPPPTEAATPRPPTAHRAGTEGSAVAPRAPRSVPPRAETTPISLDLEPLPRNTEDLTTEELLLLVKQRLERIYAALGRGS